jgi:hypothetical protein
LFLDVGLVLNLLEIWITIELYAQGVFLQILQEIVRAWVDSVEISKVEFGVTILARDSL